MGTRIGFWVENTADVKPLKGKGGQDILKTRDFQTWLTSMHGRCLPNLLGSHHLAFILRAERRC